ncbi:hypothetical protein [Pseudomonas fluorescens]|uniref:hypothetical protein n=1 Tax=Pseudomonas fluorescens TaxID=294 RepID=UPI001912B61B|nr:hypothetical protein [Pseudomonas fluorescens]
MLDRTKYDQVCIGATDLEWLVLTNLERRLIALYRKMSDQERRQIGRLSELLTTPPEENVTG